MGSCLRRGTDGLPHTFVSFAGLRLDRLRTNGLGQGFVPLCRVTGVLVDILHIHFLSGHLLRQGRGDKFVETAVEHGIGGAAGVAGA